MFNKNQVLTTAICAAALLGGTYSASSVAAVVDGHASAIVANPLTLSAATLMDFGTVNPGVTGGTVEIDATLGTVNVLGDATQTGGFNSGTFDIAGGAGLTYLVTYTNGTLSDGTNTMTLTTFNDNSAGTIPAGGTETFSVGAILTVSAGQNSGTYNTTNAGGAAYTVTVNYN